MCIYLLALTNATHESSFITNTIMELRFEKTIITEKELCEIMGYPSEILTRKIISYIDEHCKSFIEKSPFFTIATSDLNGNLDVSPKEDPAGFVKILSDKILENQSLLTYSKTKK